MRLTLVISSLATGGAERVLSLMANHWAAKGWQVTLITFDVVERDFFLIHHAVTRVALDVMGDALNPVQAIAANVQRVRLLRRAILSSHPRAVISFVDKTNVLTLLACAGLRVPVIVSERTVPMQYTIGRTWSALRRLLYPRADALVVQSALVRGWAQSFLRDETIHIIPNPVLPSAHDSSQAFQTPAAPLSGPIVAALGRLSAEKGFDILIKAAAQALEKHPAWTLMIIGDGPERKALEKLAEHLGISDHVRFPGYVKEPTRLLRHADLFILSSRFEGFPNALLEAMACGLPVISADCPSGPREIIRNGVDGLLIPSEDVDALAAAMDQLMSDAGERARLAARAAEVLSRFGIERVMGLWEEVLAGVLKPQSEVT